MMPMLMLVHGADVDAKVGNGSARQGCGSSNKPHPQQEGAVGSGNTTLQRQVASSWWLPSVVDNLGLDVRM